MKRKVKALLALALTLALVSTTLGDSWLYVSAENAAETEEQADEPEAAVEEDTEEKPAEIVEEAPQEEVVPAAEEVSEAEPGEEQTEETPAPAEEPKQAEENTQPAEKTPAEQPTDQTPAEQPAETPAQAEDQEQSADAAAPSETPAADATGEVAEKAPEAEVPGADEKATETADTEISLMEQTIEASVDTEEKDVVITLTGEMPEGAAVNACSVDVSVDGINIITAYDITIYDAEGQEFQPPEEKPLQVKIEDDAVRKALEENAELEVYHLEDAEAEPEQVQEVNLEAAAVEFQAESFSIYAVVTPEKHFTHTYSFYDEDGTTLLSEQILSEGESLTEPESPVKEHKVFDGWYTAQTGGSRFQKFGTAETELSKSIGTKLYARFTTVYYVYYKASADGKVIYTQKYFSDGASILWSSVPFTTSNVNQALIGWSVNPDANDPDQNLTIAGDDITLYPVVADAHWITYETDGGSLIEPTYVLEGNKTVSPDAPSKKGYQFAGWYSDEAYANQFVFGNELTENQTLYAKWQEAETDYKVIFWEERLEMDTYDYVGQMTDKVTTGTGVSAEEYQAKLQEIDQKNEYKYFQYDADASDKNVVIQADGSSVINVRYARKVYTFEFDLNGTDKRNYGNYANVSMTINGNTYKNNETHYTFQARYGENISDKWPTADNMGRYSRNFEAWYQGDPKDTSVELFSSKQWVVTGDLIINPYETIQLYKGNWWNDLISVELHYFGQNAEDDQYTEFGNYAQKANTTAGFNPKEIKGFVYVRNNNQTPHYNNEGQVRYYEVYNFYYDRNTYDLEFVSGSKILKTVKNIRFEKSIVDQYYEPERPADIPDYYEFDGWYTTTDCLDGTKFDFKEATMPAANLALYAKWTPKNITVTFDLNWGSEDKPNDCKDQIIQAGNMATRPQNPVRSGYVFAGWTRGSEPYNFSTLLTADVTLTAQWISNAQYELTYAPGTDGTGDPVIDAMKYAAGAKAKLCELPAAWAPKEEGNVFLCWNTRENGKGTDYYPGADFSMPEENVTLYAKWVPVRKTTLVYDYNGGTLDGKGKSDLVKIEVPNAQYEVEDFIPVRDGYEFLGWCIVKEAAEGMVLLKAGDKIQVDTLQEENNVLYAQWRKLVEVSFTVEKQVKGNMGDHNKEFDFSYSIWKENEKIAEGSFQLKADETYTELPKVAEGCRIVIQETAVNGYTTSIDAEVTNVSFEAGTFSYTVTNDSPEAAKITYTNTKTMGTPTGIMTNWISSVMMLLAAFGMAVILFFTGKRRKA